MTSSGPNKLNRVIRLQPLAGWLIVAGLCSPAVADGLPGAARFRQNVQPILETYCYGCHGYGAAEGGRTLDEFASDEAMLADIKLWSAVLKNVRAGIMPPAGEERPTAEERETLFNWIQRDVFKIDPANPDPGRVTLRRLNRVEYRHTIRDLMGVDFDTNEHFLPDDSGYGFDNIGDVLTISPLLLEKYLQAAEAIVERAVPKMARKMPERSIAGREFKSDDGKTRGDGMSFYHPAAVAHTAKVDLAGNYRVAVEIELRSGFDFDPGRAKVAFAIDGEEKFSEEYEWTGDAKFDYEIEVVWKAGEHRLSFELTPLIPEHEEQRDLEYSIRAVRIIGPIDEQHWVESPSYRRFFPKGPAPSDLTERDAYAREVLAAFANRAYRRPVDDATIERLLTVAKATYDRPGKSFEEGISRAIVAVLASPRFLYRVEDVQKAAEGELFPFIDEHALAARLSYFLWSTMPDAELRDLADRGVLRANLAGQVQRMLNDGRSKRLVENFVGQWLRSRDVQNVHIDSNAVLGLRSLFIASRRKREAHEELRRESRGKIESLEAKLEKKLKEPIEGVPEESKLAEAEAKYEQHREELTKQIKRLREELQAAEEKYDKDREGLRSEIDRLMSLRDSFNEDVRRAMRRETEYCFEHLLREDRSLLELLDADYTFANEELAKFYGIPGVEGDEMQRVELPADSPRGGILTQGTLLVVTSNPTRTSPVKRGMHILENVLGTPPPPPPPDIPLLEEAAAALPGREPTVRELLEIHRREPLCHSCHARMDPLGLALENFDAHGIWRETEKGRSISPAGELLTGEKFDSIQELKKILTERHRQDFYRCLTERLLTYALGRGLEYYDEHTVDQIVERLEANDGRPSALVTGIIESAPFQRRRRAE